MSDEQRLEEFRRAVINARGRMGVRNTQDYIMGLSVAQASAALDALDARDAEIARLRSTLAFYAKSDNWNQPDGDAPVLADGGDLARAVLINTGGNYE